MRSSGVIDVGMVVLHKALDILKVERDSCSETYLTSDDGNEVSDIKLRMTQMCEKLILCQQYF
jgi:hypothetical protein